MDPFAREYEIRMAPSRQAEADREERAREFNATQASHSAFSREASRGLTSLVDLYNQSYAQAKQEYEGRYQQMLGITNNVTQQRMADVRSDYGQRGADAMQRLARLGMANTTVGVSEQAGNQREMQQELNRTADSLAQTKLGVIAGHLTDQQLAPPSDVLRTAMAGAAQAGGFYGGQNLRLPTTSTTFGIKGF